MSPKIKAVIKIFLGKCLCMSHYIKKWEHYAIAFIDNYCNNIIEVFGRIYGKNGKMKKCSENAQKAYFAHVEYEQWAKSISGKICLKVTF